MARRRKRRSWIDHLPLTLRERINALVDADVEPAAYIYRELNLVRFIGPRAFRLYASRRRARVRA